MAERHEPPKPVESPIVINTTGSEVMQPVDIKLDLGAITPQRLTEQYAEEYLVRLPGLLTPESAQQLLETTREVPIRRVTNHRYRSTWERDIVWPSQDFAPGHPVHDFFGHQKLLELIESLTGVGVSRAGRRCWSTCCRAEEEVGPHRDGEGLIHIIVGLQASEGPEYGGELVVQDETEQRIFLNPGDAIAFQATRWLHHTTPLIRTESNPNPQRVAIIGVYYAL